MGPRRERTLTIVLVAACLSAGAAAAAVRLGARPAPVHVATPELTVHVRGAVAAPGSYRLPWGARVADLIAAAGGLTGDAETTLIEVGAPLTDGASVVVPSSRAIDGDDRVDVNTASERLLTTLPGVGPATARRIVERRPYHRLDDLLRVPGIGPVRLDRLRGHVRL